MLAPAIILLLATITCATPLHHLKRQVTINETTTGVFTCSLPNWQGGCAWEDTSGSPRCRLIPWTDALTHSPQNNGTTSPSPDNKSINGTTTVLSRVSIGADAGNHCILYESARCDENEGGGSYLLRNPGTTDLVAWAQGQGVDVAKTGLYSMLCLSEGLVGYYFRPKNGAVLR